MANFIPTQLNKIKQKYGYVVRYGILEAMQIFNAIGPERHGCSDWYMFTMEQRRQKAKMLISRRNKVDNFYHNLEQSILTEGFRNPICVTAGHLKPPEKITKLPPEMQADPSKILAADVQGASRLHFAQKYNRYIPCFIVDFVNRFSNFEAFKSTQEIFDKCMDKPTNISCYSWGIYLHILPSSVYNEL